MATETLKLKLVGVSPLMMHNGQLADPTNKFTKAVKQISSRRKKTDEDFAELKRIEWLGGLYLDEKGEVAITADMILGCVIGGAKKNKNGPGAKAGVYEKAPFFKLVYDGPTKPEELYDDGRFCDYRGVKVGTARVMRSRPIFGSWSVSVALEVDTEIIDSKDVIQAIAVAGEKIGLGDYRPRFGRFTVARIR